MADGIERKSQIQILEPKNAEPEMMNSLDGFNSRLDVADKNNKLQLNVSIQDRALRNKRIKGWETRVGENPQMETITRKS